MHQHKKHEYPVWEPMLELQPYKGDAGPKNPEPVTLLINLEKLLKRLHESGVELGNILQIHQSCCCEGCVIVLRASEKSSVRRQCGTAILPGSKFSVVWVWLALQDAMKAVFKVWPEVRIQVYVDDKKVTCASKEGGRSNRSSKEGA